MREGWWREMERWEEIDEETEMERRKREKKAMDKLEELDMERKKFEEEKNVEKNKERGEEK
ncbi:MAG: hypothetical protein MASP_01743 [Candidatus Methanolliviera sp. GoM_asphalt]|nr:MAG: hypothetical protein MASP_01743 [Candidatus Methanolliviera sp. GoM_asphalt]